jgi:nicotinamidase-related amidase
MAPVNTLRSLLLVAGLLVGIGVAAAPLPADAPVTALIVIDIQDFYFPGGSMPLVGPEVASANAARLLAHARDGGRLVVHVGHNAASGRGFRADVAPREDEGVVMKDDVNAFLGTDLQARLETAGIRRVVICGMQTHMCVEAAARAAHDLGYEVVVVADACATRDLEFGDMVVPAAQVHAATLATLNKTYARVLDTTASLAQF